MRVLTALLLALPALAGLPDPWQAYGQGDFRAARDGFEELARERPRDLRLAVDLGSARYQLGDFAGAEEAFARAARSARLEVAAQALYGLGNAAYRQGRLEEAIGHWEQNLSLAPGDEDARFNLELARRELARRRAQQPQQPASQPAGTVTEGEARRLLAALAEQRPTSRPARQARRTASGKDW
ncbi:MAG TPA: tetratricopeptide repeat protein [Thermoanaerobaculia bacterium]|nr:tetratricopeptide repeat protein [Thermoanaerobaculia bacterium]